MSSAVVVLPGDGIGPEVPAQAARVLEAVAEKLGFSLEIREALLGGAAFDAVGQPLPEETLALCRDADAIFLGAVGGPQWDDIAVELRKSDCLSRGLHPAIISGEDIQSNRGIVNIANVDTRIVVCCQSGVPSA